MNYPRILLGRFVINLKFWMVQGTNRVMAWPAMIGVPSFSASTALVKMVSRVAFQIDHFQPPYFPGYRPFSMAHRTIAIGDIHGCANALKSLLDVICPESTDTIITLGDYVDRGPASSEVFDILTDLISVCVLVPILGNHEVMMQNALSNRREFEFWLFNGGHATVRSYGGDINNMPMHHRTFLKHCKRYHETDSHIFLHAAYDPATPLARQPDELLLWQHVDEKYTPDPHVSGKTVICGHTPQVDGEILDLGHIQIIDTFCYGDRWLTALDVESGESIQARADGKLREGRNAFANSNGSIIGPSRRSATRTKDDSNRSSEKDWPFTESAPSVLELDGESFKKVLESAGERLARTLDNLEEHPVLNNSPTGWSVDDLIREIDEPLPESGTQTEKILDRIISRYAPTSFNTTSHGYLAYVPGGGLPDSGIADLISNLTNRFVTVWQAAPAMAQMESTVIRWFCDMMGYDANAGGFLTSGGSIANLSAVIAARVKMAGEDFRLARIYASSQCHHCVPKAAFLAGFPKSNFRYVDVNDDQTISMEALSEAINADREAGFHPMMVVANAGTTNTGAVDNLPAIREICTAEKLWMHADAAYGGFFMLTESGRHILNGINSADSIVLDPHKGIFLPYGTGCLLVKDRSDLRSAFHFTSDYMPDTEGDPEKENFCEISPELSRDNRAMRVWFPIKRHGIAVFRELLEEKVALVAWTHQQLVDLAKGLSTEYTAVSLELVAPPQLTILAFRLKKDGLDARQTDSLNKDWLAEINRLGSVMMSGTVLNDQFVLRICIMSFRTHIDRMELAIRDIGQAVRTVLGRRS